jgi:hypothetical protein
VNWGFDKSRASGYTCTVRWILLYTPVERRDCKDALMQLCDPWPSGDGAEASIWDDLREDILPRDIDPLAARSRSAKAVCLRRPGRVPG